MKQVRLFLSVIFCGLFAATVAASPVCESDNTLVSGNRPPVGERLFVSPVIEAQIEAVKCQLKNPKLAKMFENCFPNTLDTTVFFRTDSVDGKNDTFVITGDIHAMWLRDSAAQVYPYVRFASQDEALRQMIEGTIRRQIKSILIDPYANAFNDGSTGGEWQSDFTTMVPEVHERKWEIDSLCYPVRLAYEYWKRTGDTSVFDGKWLDAVDLILQTFREQQRKDNPKGPYRFLRRTDRALDTLNNVGWGSPVSGCGLIVSCFRPSDDSTTFQYLVPSNFFAVTTLRKMAEILSEVNNDGNRADQCTALADEVSQSLKKYAVYNHPEFGEIYAFEVDGFGNRMLMDDANVPSLLAMPYLGDVEMDDTVYRNTRKFVWSKSNPYFFSGKAGEGIGGPHVGYSYAWPMSIMMKAFTADNDEEIAQCVRMLMNTDADTGFMHESFNVNDANDFTRSWFAWQNTLFGELILKLIDDGKLDLLNSL
ncbi:MAG: glycoside hydrolase family 125 protein [Paramuribaculum sp.]|nr:glycoside hydrolase family 125 protein [Paramuribaculum sp.]